MDYLFNSSAELSKSKAVKAEIQAFIFLAFGKHILDKKAEQILRNYKRYFDKNKVSLAKYAYEYLARETKEDTTFK